MDAYAIPRPSPTHPARSLRRPVAVVAVAVVMFAGAGRLLDILPSSVNPFATRPVDRSEPPVLHALEDLASYEAARANYSVIVDLEEDARWLPSFVKGERTTYVAAGEVAASVDFSRLGPETVSVSGDGTSVRIALPHATLSEPRLDNDRSRVVARARGVLDRLGGVFADTPTSERPLALRAEEQLAAAAAADAELVDRAEANTRQMLEQLLAPFGISDVAVTFGSDSPAAGV